jgi:hypothetical protein
MRQALFLIVILTSLSVVYSQHNDLSVTDEGDSIIVPPKAVKNAVKTDAFSWIFGTGVLKYERVFSENISAQLGFFYSWDFPSYDEGYFTTGLAYLSALYFKGLMRIKRLRQTSHIFGI